MGTAGFVSPRNIKEAVIGFRVMNSWLADNGITAADIRLVRRTLFLAVLVNAPYIGY